MNDEAWTIYERLDVNMDVKAEYNNTKDFTDDVSKYLDEWVKKIEDLRNWTNEHPQEAATELGVNIKEED